MLQKVGLLLGRTFCNNKTDSETTICATSSRHAQRQLSSSWFLSPCFYFAVRSPLLALVPFTDLASSSCRLGARLQLAWEASQVLTVGWCVLEDQHRRHLQVQHLQRHCECIVGECHSCRRSASGRSISSPINFINFSLHLWLLTLYLSLSSSCYCYFCRTLDQAQRQPSTLFQEFSLTSAISATVRRDTLVSPEYSSSIGVSFHYSSSSFTTLLLSAAGKAHCRYARLCVSLPLDNWADANVFATRLTWQLTVSSRP